MCCLRLGEAGFPNSGKTVTCKQPPNPGLIPLLLGALVSRERHSGLWGHMAAAALKEHSFTEGEACSGFLRLARRGLLVPRPPELGGWGIGTDRRDGSNNAHDRN